jgi:hypothetical protein
MLSILKADCEQRGNMTQKLLVSFLFGFVLLSSTSILANTTKNPSNAASKPAQKPVVSAPVVIKPGALIFNTGVRGPNGVIRPGPQSPGSSTKPYTAMRGRQEGGARKTPPANPAAGMGNPSRAADQCSCPVADDCCHVDVDNNCQASASCYHTTKECPC